MGTRSIAKLLGISRNTVRRALRQEVWLGYERGKKVNPHVEPFVDFIRARYLERGDKVSLIIKEMRKRGYEGSDSAVYRHVEKYLKEERAEKSRRAFMPYETSPGEQMQYDWTNYSVTFGDRVGKVYVHLLLFSYSRYKVFSASLSIRQSDVFEALEEGFSEVGGVCRRLQTDNARVFVEDSRKSQFRWNRRYLDFCGFYGISPSRSFPGHPWSKGKVERPFAHLETHFIGSGRFSSFEDFLEKLKRYQDEVNGSVHSVTGASPTELLLKERPFFLELPRNSAGEDRKYIGYKEEFRKVSSDCLISYGGNRYSVPHLFVGKEVWVRVSKGVTLLIYSSRNELIASHKLSFGKGEVVIVPEHYRGYRGGKEHERFSESARVLKERFGVLYERVDQFIESVRVQKKTNPAYHLSRIVKVFDDYTEEACVSVMENCFRYNTFSSSFVMGCITGMERKPLEAVQAPKLPRAFPSGRVKRPLEEYQLRGGQERW